MSLEKTSTFSLMEFFSDDHKHHTSMITQFFDRRNNRKTGSKFLKEFIWSIERHFFLEEKAVLQFFKIDLRSESDLFIRFYQEHTTIIRILDRIKKNLGNEPTFVIETAMYELKDLINEHYNFEITSFYPKIDKQLDTFQKEYLVKILNQSVNRGFFPLSKIREEAREFFKDDPEILEQLGEI